MKIFGVTGWKNSGKTHLVERLVTEITARGFSVSTVKHAHHEADIDRPGRDSYRHRIAGAREVMLATPARWALVHELREEKEPPLAELLAKLSPVDLVLIEGFKREGHAKIEVHRTATGHPLIAPQNLTVRAIASDATPDTMLPLLHLDDTDTIADFILKEIGL